jgi:hypothetical protein
MKRAVTIAVLATLAVVTVAVARSGPQSAVADEPRQRPGGRTAADRPSARDVEGVREFAMVLTERAERQVPLPVDKAVALERSLASDAGADELAARVARDLDALSEAGDRAEMTYWVAPLAMRVTKHSADGATVEVWQVGALAIAGVRVSQHWVTVTYDLVWERGRWRLDAERSADGPQPQTLAGTLPASASTFAALLDGFASVDATDAGAAG